jgi:hypothetical protein
MTLEENPLNDHLPSNISNLLWSLTKQVATDVLTLADVIGKLHKNGLIKDSVRYILVLDKIVMLILDDNPSMAFALCRINHIIWQKQLAITI